MQILPFAVPVLALLTACGQPTPIPVISTLDAATKADHTRLLTPINGLSGFVSRPIDEPIQWRKSNDDRAPKQKGTN